MPNVSVTVREGAVAASCLCGWSCTVPTADPAGEGMAHIMAMVDAHLEAHRRQR